MKQKIYNLLMVTHRGLLENTYQHVGFAIAWFDQHESSEDRYLFFRSAYKHFMGFYSWPDDDLDDKDVANILGINPMTCWPALFCAFE